VREGLLKTWNLREDSLLKIGHIHALFSWGYKMGQKF